MSETSADVRVRDQMLTEVVTVDAVRPDAETIGRAAAVLRSGGLVAFPTETVYGLGVNALNRGAVLRLFEVKARPANDPLIVHVPSLADAATLVVDLPAEVARLADRFWPGPLTLIVRRSDRIPPEVSAGLDTVAIRIPVHPVARALLLAAGVPVAAPSANLFTRPSPTTAEHVLQDLGGRIDMVVDGGRTDVGVESTVLDLTVRPPVVLRPGATGVEQLRTVLPDVTMAAAPGPGTTDNMPMASPGLLSKHYAPRARVTLYRGDTQAVIEQWRKIAVDAHASGELLGVLATVEDARRLRDLRVTLVELGNEDDVETIASRLYAGLRELDAAGVGRILVRDVGRDHGLWRAIGDRLRRAATDVVGKSGR